LLAEGKERPYLGEKGRLTWSVENVAMFIMERNRQMNVHHVCIQETTFRLNVRSTKLSQFLIGIKIPAFVLVRSEQKQVESARGCHNILYTLQVFYSHYLSLTSKYANIDVINKINIPIDSAGNSFTDGAGGLGFEGVIVLSALPSPSESTWGSSLLFGYKYAIDYVELEYHGDYELKEPARINLTITHWVKGIAFDNERSYLIEVIT